MESILGKCKLNHTCVITKDLERLKKNYATLVGVEVPQTIVNKDYATMDTWFKGSPAPNTGLEQTAVVMDGGTIELIMHNEGPSAWNDFLEEHGEGIHHFCFEVNDLVAVVERCEANGIKKIQTGKFPGGHYAYVDGRDYCGAYLELLEMF